MKGVQYVVDDSGRKKAVILDLEEWGELWEDFSDILVSEARKGEPVVDWEELKDFKIERNQPRENQKRGPWR